MDDASKTRQIKVNGVVVGEIPSTGDVNADLAAMQEFLRAHKLIPDRHPARLIQGQAHAFSLAAEAIYTKYIQPKANGFAAIPFVVNSAFSIELYLKTLLFLERGSYPKEHSLLKLHAALSHDVRDRLDRDGRAYAPLYMPLTENPDTFNFSITIGELDNAFVEWRYANEKGTGVVKVYPTIIVLKTLHELSQDLIKQQEQAA